MAVPVVDVTALVGGAGDPAQPAAAIDAACRDTGFFTVVGHGIDSELRRQLDTAARRFFALDDEAKSGIAMARGGRAWRGWFPVGGELTSGVPDRKEGIYFGAELAADDPRVAAGLALHGPNLFPEEPAELRSLVLAYMDDLSALGHALTRGVALGLGLDGDWFRTNLTAEPTILFRIFCYPAEPAAGYADPSGPSAPAGANTGQWGVAEHTDYGLLTILGQDGSGGLQVRSRSGWIDVEADPDAFVCNIGDMLERITGGAYRSTPHRVRSPRERPRLSFPFFFDPGWDAQVRPLPGVADPDPTDEPRWDGASVHRLGGTYGDYLLAKVAKVFPELGTELLPGDGGA